MFDESGERIELTEDDIKNGKLEEVKIDGQKYCYGNWKRNAQIQPYG